MPSTGPVYPGTVTTQAVTPENAENWVSPTNVGADDGAEAQITAASYDTPDISYRLKATNFDLSAIPAGDVPDGITVEIDRRAFAGTAKDYRVQLLDETGALVGDNKADTVNNWPSTSTVKSYGGATDTWGWTTVTRAKLTDPDFGIVLAVQATSANADIGADFLRVTVDHHTPPPPPPSFSSGSVADSGRDWDAPFQDVTITFDKAVQDAALGVGGTATGHTVKVNGVAQATTYRSGSGTATWVLRVPVLVDAGDTVTYSYDQAAGNTTGTDGSGELTAVTDAAVTNSLTKRARFTLKKADGNPAASETVKYSLHNYGGGDPADASFMVKTDKGTHVTSAAGSVDVPYNGGSNPGDTIYVVVIRPDTNPVESFIWPLVLA